MGPKSRDKYSVADIQFYIISGVQCSDLTFIYTRNHHHVNKCFYKGRRHRHRGEGHAKTEAEAGGRRPQAKDCLEPPETEKEPRIDPPKGPHMKHGPTDILISEFSPVEV